MNEVLNNVDLSDKEFFIKLKNKHKKKRNFKFLEQKLRLKSKHMQLNSVRKDNSEKYNNEFYYNKSLGCKINFKKIILNERNNHCEEANQNNFSLFNGLKELSSNKKLKNKRINYIHNNKKKINYMNSNSENGLKDRLYK